MYDGAGVAMVVRLFGARSALPRRPVSFGPCSRARRRQALVRWSPLHRFETRRFWGSRRSAAPAGIHKCFKCKSFSPQSSATGRRHGDGVRGVSQASGGTYQGSITFLLSLWAGAEHRSWPRGGFVLNPRRSRLPEIPAEAGAVGAVSRGERACSLPVTRTRVRAGVAPRGCPVREGVERVVSVYLRDGVDESRPSTSTATRRWG